jgi:hypothetical protein
VSAYANTIDTSRIAQAEQEYVDSETAKFVNMKLTPLPEEKMRRRFKINPIQRVFIVDETGEYGLTEWARGIVETPDNLPILKAYLDSPKFENLRSAIQIDSTRFNIKIACKFKKDFWK